MCICPAPQGVNVQAEKTDRASRPKEVAPKKRQVDNHRSLVWISREMDAAVRVVDLAAKSSCTVLLLGETGTGKELLARILHDRSERRQKKFLEVNCSAIPDTLLESELFGHEAGAFTDARRSKRGKLEMADGGTVFFDEVGDLSPVIQAKILRVLQERTFERLGGTETMKVDVRIVAATNRDLSGMVEEGKFRGDLYHRLNVIPILVPPLRFRREDILVLSQHFIAEIAAANQRPVPQLSAEIERDLIQYHWPGNVRELENRIERAMVFLDGQESFTLEHLTAFGADPFSVTSDDLSPEGTLNMDEVKRRVVVAALERAGGNRKRAAIILGVTRPTLHDWLNKYGLKNYKVKNPIPRLTNRSEAG